MDLYHIHTLRNHDNKYGENKELIINEQNYSNKLYDRAMNMNSSVDTDKFKRIVKVINEYNLEHGFVVLGDKVELANVLGFVIKNGCSEEELYSILYETQRILVASIYLKRELALENFRKENCPDKPSRMHSLFACTEDGLDYWKGHIHDDDVDVYRIDPMDTVFRTNEQLLPDENLSYIMAYNQARKYFNPKSRDLNGISDEYLIQGRVRLLDKVDEIRR